MQFTVFDVGHGFCALLVDDHENYTLFDCGYDDAIGFRPSSTLPQMGVPRIDNLVISHYDEDHVGDLPYLRTVLPVATLTTNRSVSTEQISAIKAREGRPSFSLCQALSMAAQYSTPLSPEQLLQPVRSGIRFEYFHNTPQDFADTNNLSVVTFIHHPDVNIVVPGDIKEDGWLNLMRNPVFIANLRSVDVFVASHHGRENGYCESMFNRDYFGNAICSPEIVIISDTEKTLDSQEHEYDDHAIGILATDGGGDVRKVFTTRHDGNITLATNQNGGYTVYTRYPEPPLPREWYLPEPPAWYVPEPRY